MVGSRPRRDSGAGESDPYDVEPDDSRYTIGSILSAFVPTALARRAVAVSVDTDRDVYARDDPVEITVEFKNRLPVPVSVPTQGQRRWGWTIDGELEASDERRYTRDRPATFRFRAGERKQVRFTWHGRLERTVGDRHESIVPEPGEYELRAFVACEGRSRPSDSTTVRLE